LSNNLINAPPPYRKSWYDYILFMSQNGKFIIIHLAQVGQQTC
jgi:hypothetical protein